MTQEASISERRSRLSAAKRALLEKRLQGTLAPGAKSQVISRRPEPDVVPLSFAQERFWFLDQFEPGNPAYNRPVALRLTGPLDVTALEQTLGEILRRHQVLRATFPTVEGRPVQIITSTQPLTLPVVDLSEFPLAEREPQAMQLATKEAQRPFDLAQGPLLRATLLRLDREEHVLHLVIHHIAIDAWSANVLVEELAALYEAFSTGKPSPLPKLPIQYADFAHWQRQWLQGEVLETQLSYWEGKLAGSPPALELPTDRPRPAMQTYRGACHSLVLSSSLLQLLQTLSRQEEVTLFMTLLAAFKVLLSRYTGQDDITVGSPIAGRTRVETEQLIGFFVNTLALRTDLSGNPTFRELLRRVRETALEAYAHQDLPFEKLVQELNPERDSSRTPLFQVMFNLESIPKEVTETHSLTIDEFEFDRGIAPFDLTLEIIEKDAGLSCLLNYNADLFDAITIKRMLGHYQTLLEGIVFNPNQRLSELPLLTEAEEHQLLVEWNDTHTDYPRDLCLHQLFEAQVARTPDAVAVVFDGEQLTYQELNQRANQLGHYLHGLGVGPEVLVGICVERSLEMMFGPLGILKAGGAYVPLDPAYPKERLAFMLEDTQVPVLLTQQRLVEGLPAHRAKTVCLDADWETIAQESDANLANETTADNLAYVMYTSGSTGRPKGVQITHRAICNHLLWRQQAFPLTEHDRFLHKASLSFDVSVWEIFAPLVAGARLVLARPGGEMDAAYLAQLVADQSITNIHFPPVMLQLFLEERRIADCKSLQRVFCGGEAMPIDLKERFFARLDAELYNQYGPTETTVDVSIWHCRSTHNRVVVPIGRPIANTQLYILDTYLQPVPIGVPGELHVGGLSLARGYLNRPELTAQKFIPSPFTDEPGARLYKTGDLARYLPDGNIEFLGRADNQVKIRGFRIELGEIETVLGRHPTVQKTVVLAREDMPGDKRLVAYLVAHQGPAPSISELRRFLQDKLPEYMVPSAFVILDALPLTPTGKVDRRALPAPHQARQESEETFVSPRDELELQLTRTWEQVLGIQPIGVKDNFFDLGGHSLLAVRLFAQIEKTMGKNLPLATLFQAPTVEQLASFLRQEVQPSPVSSLVALQLGGSKPPFFCLPGNLGNVFVDLGDLIQHLGPDQPFYALQDGIQNPAQIEALAAHYLDEIRTVQPEGPYLLGGVCSGGTTAFEMAQQLQAQGQRVALLALVEIPPPRVPGLRSYLSFAARIFPRIVRRFGRHSRNVSQLDPAEQGAYIRLKMKVLANQWALARYAPQPYQGRIHLFLASESLEPSRDPRSGWGELATDGAELHLIPGTHDTITRTHDAVPDESQVRVLGQQLRTCIDDALADGRKY